MHIRLRIFLTNTGRHILLHSAESKRRPLSFLISVKCIDFFVCINKSVLQHLAFHWVVFFHVVIRGEATLASATLLSPPEMGVQKGLFCKLTQMMGCENQGRKWVNSLSQNNNNNSCCCCCYCWQQPVSTIRTSQFECTVD